VEKSPVPYNLPVKLDYELFDLERVRTYPLASRQSKVRHDLFAKPWSPDSGFSGWIASLPRILAAAELAAVVTAMRRARDGNRAIVWGLGAHVIKTGLAPVIIDLMERGFVSAVALNGAGLIHDFEVALAGATSEDVEANLGPGTFGMAEETGRDLNDAIRDGAARNLGLGQAVVEHLARRAPAFAHVSLLSAAGRLGVPVTVHVGIGTDIIHMHPAASGEAIGAASLRDFRYFTSFVAKLEGGVYLNCGSAVMLPEVFLKAVSLVRNRGISLEGITTVNFDFIKNYRSETNVVRRPVAGIGKGYSFTGHHEIMLPLLAAALKS
jgi:Deoxyhypusine synthase